MVHEKTMYQICVGSQYHTYNVVIVFILGTQAVVDPVGTSRRVDLIYCPCEAYQLG